MKKKQYILTVLVGVVMLLTGGFLGFRLGTDKERNFAQSEVKRETSIDTVTVRAPKPQMALTTGTRFYTLPIYRYIATGGGSEDTTSATASVQLKRYGYGTGAGGKPRLCRNEDSLLFEQMKDEYTGEWLPGCDSAIVELPTIQRHYADSTYDAWVSGPIDPKLDSLRVYARTEIITKRERWPPKHWHIGVTAGYGYGPKGFQPYIGVGVTYSIFSF